MRQSPNIDHICKVAKCLGPLRDQFVFLGGAVTELLITDPAAPPARGTEDVDVLVEVLSMQAYSQIELQLRELGFKHDMMSGVICRWKLDGLVVDVMPTCEEVLGFGNRWYQHAWSTSESMAIAPDLIVRVITAPYFIATKVDAFDNPSRDGHGDFLGSRDIADIIALVDGRIELVEEVNNADRQLRQFLSD